MEDDRHRLCCRVCLQLRCVKANISQLPSLVPSSALLAFSWAFEPLGWASFTCKLHYQLSRWLHVSSIVKRRTFQVTPINCILWTCQNNVYHSLPIRERRKEEHAKICRLGKTLGQLLFCIIHCTVANVFVSKDSECKLVCYKVSPPPPLKTVITLSLNIFIKILYEHFILCGSKMRIKC